MIVTFYSETGHGEHTRLLARTVGRLATGGHSVLCIDWDLAGASLGHELGAPSTRYGVVTLLTEPTPYIRRVGSYIDLLPAGRGHIPAGYTDWARQYRTDHFADRLEASCERLRASYEVVAINAPPHNDGSRGIHLAHLPDVIVAVYTPDTALHTVDTLRRVDEARDHLPYGRGQLIVVPVPLRRDSATILLFEPWLRAWVPRNVPVTDAAAALTMTDPDDPGLVRRLSRLLKREFEPSPDDFRTEPLGRSRFDWHRWRSTLPPRERMAELAKAAIERAAPQEARFFDVIAASYLDDPRRVLARAGTRGDVVLGIGVELTMETLTQAAVYVAMQVLYAFSDLASDTGSLRVALRAGLQASAELGLGTERTIQIVDAMLDHLRSTSPEVLNESSETEGA